jgi:thiamine-monophosphate kinase
MGGGAEFDTVRAMLAAWGRTAEGIGDDAALLEVGAAAPLVLTTDACVEGVHFRNGWLSPEEIGERAAAAALSDLAAMGARARAVLVALTVPDDRRDAIAGIAAGIGRMVDDADARIVGGNLTSGPALSVTITVVGSADRPVSRGGARPGDSLWVTGRLGGPAAARRALEAGETPPPALRDRFAAPRARLRSGEWMANVGAHAMIDVSDGLVADAGHLAAASGLICELWPDRLPLVEGATIDDALSGGEEYELLVAAGPDLDTEGFARRYGIPLTRVGVVRAVGTGETPVVTLRETDADAPARVATTGGHDHFSR